MSKIIFISDIHLGIDHASAYPNRKQELLQKLASWRAEGITHLFLMGDIFEFWMEYNDFIPKGDFDFLCEIQQMIHAGIEVHYYAGNHDFNLGQFFEKQMGMHVSHEPACVELQGRKIVLLHGDGMAASDSKYRFAKKIITHPCSNFLFKLIHPDWGMALARFVGQTSRDQHEYGPVKWDEYEAAAVELMNEFEADVCINGHIHVDRYQELGTQLYLNIGQWFHSPTWIELEGGEFSIKRLTSELN